jgi:hypothetical protein
MVVYYLMLYGYYHSYYHSSPPIWHPKSTPGA